MILLFNGMNRIVFAAEMDLMGFYTISIHMNGTDLSF